MVTNFPANYASALAFELRRGPAPEDRDFLRIKFKNGTNDNFQTFHAFGHKADIPLTEFFYRSEVSWVPPETRIPISLNESSPRVFRTMPSPLTSSGPPPAKTACRAGTSTLALRTV